jgi:hypothetical protein
MNDENQPFLSWFYAEPALWADLEFVQRHKESLDSRSEYLRCLPGVLGDRIRSLHSKWVSGACERLVRGASIVSVYLRLQPEKAEFSSELTFMLLTRSGESLMLRYENLTLKASSSVLDFRAGCQLDSHEFQLAKSDSIAPFVHFLYLSGGGLLKIQASELLLIEQNPGSGLAK